MKFRKKPIVIEAEQWFPGKSVDGVNVDYRNDEATIITIHGQHALLAPGDWVITEPDGIHHYPCKPDIFAAVYELVE